MDTTRETKALESLMESINSMSWDAKAFAKAAVREHRTLQQSLVRTMVAVIKEMAAAEYYDGRNAASVELCKEIVESGILDKHALPFI